MIRILGIDYGSAKIGLAIADSETTLAMPFDIIYKNSIGEQLAVLRDIIKREKIDELVVGWPLSLDNKVTAQTKKVEDFLKELAVLNLPIHRQDERLSTQAASRTTSKQDDDAIAAMYILQAYLDGKNNDS
ncbi:MAG: Holliday junction resolvase RuvX [Candidatus Komeilibacteria bacterium]